MSIPRPDDLMAQIAKAWQQQLMKDFDDMRGVIEDFVETISAADPRLDYAFRVRASAEAIVKRVHPDSVPVFAAVAIEMLCAERGESGV